MKKLFFLFVIYISIPASMFLLHGTSGDYTRQETYQTTTMSRINEFLIDSIAVYGSAGDAQYQPSTAFDGTNFFVVWEDHRSGAEGIYFSRIDTTGNILDSVGIRIGSGYEPDVKFNGLHYFVAWSYAHATGFDIYGARVMPDGTILDTAGIPICSVVGYQTRPRVSYDSTNWFVVWLDEREGLFYRNIYGGRVTPAGQVLDPDGIPICTLDQEQQEPEISYDGTNHLVVWSDHRSIARYDIYGARVTPAGAVLDMNGFPISTTDKNKRYPSVAFDGTNYFVVWQDSCNVPSYDIYGVRVSPTATIIDTVSLPISTWGGDQFWPSIEFFNNQYLVLWSDFRWGDSHIYGARVLPDGTVLDSNGIAITAEDDWQTFATAASDGNNYLISWHHGEYMGDRDIYCTRMDTSGYIIDTTTTLVSQYIYYYNQRVPAVAFADSYYFVAWTDYRHTSLDIFGARIAESGGTIDTIMISICSDTMDQGAAAIACGNQQFLVVWHDRRNGTWDIYGSRISAAGVVLDSTSICISAASISKNNPSVASNGVDYFVVWVDSSNTTDYDIYGARVSSSGVLVDTNGIPISAINEQQQDPDVTFDGSNYFVTWSDYRNSSDYDVYGARVSPDGILIDSSGILVSGAVYNQEYPHVIFDGVTHFIVWQDTRNAGNRDIYGARVLPDGSVLDSAGIPISTRSFWERNPVITYNGINYLVAWREGHTGSGFDIYGAVLDSAVTVVDTFSICAWVNNQEAPVCISGQDEQMLLVYEGWVDSLYGFPVGAKRIWGLFYPFVGIEENYGLKQPITRSCLQIYPNPTHRKWNIKYYICSDIGVSISLFDVTGRLINELLDEYQEMGIHEATFDMNELPQGIYFVKLEIGAYKETRKIILVK